MLSKLLMFNAVVGVFGLEVDDDCMHINAILAGYFPDMVCLTFVWAFRSFSDMLVNSGAARSGS